MLEFLDLPQEIRDVIYSDVFKKNTGSSQPVDLTDTFSIRYGCMSLSKNGSTAKDLLSATLSGYLPEPWCLAGDASVQDAR
jgi:hypothetical protein